MIIATTYVKQRNQQGGKYSETIKAYDRKAYVEVDQDVCLKRQCPRKSYYLWLCYDVMYTESVPRQRGTGHIVFRVLNSGISGDQGLQPGRVQHP